MTDKKKPEDGGKSGEALREGVMRIAYCPKCKKRMARLCNIGGVPEFFVCRPCGEAFDFDTLEPRAMII